MNELSNSPDDNFDPAKSKALTEAFEASRDALDQMGQRCALQHHDRRVNIVKDTKLGSNPFESKLLAMPLNPSWLFGEGIQDVVDKVRAQESAQTSLLANTFSLALKKGPFRIFGPSHAFGSQQQTTNNQSREQPIGILEDLSRENLNMLIRVGISSETAS